MFFSILGHRFQGSEAKFVRRAAFLKHNLWISPYTCGEDFPGGEFPNQNLCVGEGLASWVQQNRSLEETDNVCIWDNSCPRLEDWYVIPVVRIGYMLQPHGFFNCSPAVDVKEGHVKLTIAPKSISNGLIAML
ncbi:unnamed protein product [Lactuca saligna]|uniref:Amine oxidase n=1 Tax=Lactuca saligna TaxID=75948 RepID=A0AA36E504_LACSI|nr:unnamed protein product [Lactuca saligna]